MSFPCTHCSLTDTATFPTTLVLTSQSGADQWNSTQIAAGVANAIAIAAERAATEIAIAANAAAPTYGDVACLIDPSQRSNDGTAPPASANAAAPPTDGGGFGNFQGNPSSATPIAGPNTCTQESTVWSIDCTSNALTMLYNNGTDTVPVNFFNSTTNGVGFANSLSDYNYDQSDDAVPVVSGLCL